MAACGLYQDDLVCRLPCHRKTRLNNGTLGPGNRPEGIFVGL